MKIITLNGRAYMIYKVGDLYMVGVYKKVPHMPRYEAVTYVILNHIRELRQYV